MTVLESDSDHPPARNPDWPILPPDQSAFASISSGRRRALGCYPTPWPLAELMAWMLSGSLPPEGRVIDPAAGTGRLLVCMAKHFAGDRHFRDASGRLCGVELDPELTEFTNRLFEPQSRSLWPVCIEANALKLLDVEERRNRLGSEDFAGVIANPPYVREKHNRRLFVDLLEATPAWRPYFAPRQDLQQLFLILGMQLLAPGGHLVFLTNPYWLQSDSGQVLRAMIRERTRWMTLVDFSGLVLFPEAKGQHNLLVHLRDRRLGAPDRQATFIRVCGRPEGGLSRLCRAVREVISGSPAPSYLQTCEAPDLVSSGLRRRFYLPGSKDALLDRMQRASTPLGSTFETHQGIISGADRVTLSNLKHLSGDARPGGGIFVVTAEEKSALELTADEEKILRPIYRARDLRPYAVDKGTERFLIYLRRGHDIEDYPQLKRHLERFRPLLERRREVVTGQLAWFEIHWPRNPALFQRPRVVTPRRATAACFAMGLTGYCEQSDIAMITADDDQPTRLEALLVVLNSPVMSLWVAHRLKHKGSIREFFGRSLEEMPIPLAMVETPDRFLELASLADGHDVDAADRQVATLYGL